MNPTLRVSRRAADRLRVGHLWVYRSDLEPGHAPAPANADIVTLAPSRGQALGSALYSAHSQIAARLVSKDPNLTRDGYLDDVHTRIRTAIQRRRNLAPDSNAQRLVFAEADELPGIIADRYHDLVIVQLLIPGTAQDDVRQVLVRTLRAELAPNNEPLTIWERPDPRIRELEHLPAPPNGPLFTNAAGEPPTGTIFTLNGLQFTFDAAAGQKTGAFLDQRLNYAAAAAHVLGSGQSSSGLRGLDICTYQGGFALHLAQVCARVTGVDASRSALEAADRNLALNPQLTAEVDWIEADAFDYLRHLDNLAHPNSAIPTATSVLSTHSSAIPTHPSAVSTTPFVISTEAERSASPPTNPHLFDAIVLDPPAFAKSKRATGGALRGYKELNLRALRLLAPGGTLITCSCSHHVSLEDFTAIVAAAAADAHRRVQLLETRAAAPDHPEILTLPETRYLKCLICRVD